jgi:hypothetical protein
MGSKKAKISSKRLLKLQDALNEMSKNGMIGESAYARLLEILNPIDPNSNITIQLNNEAGALHPTDHKGEGTDEVDTPHTAVLCEMVDDGFDVVSDFGTPESQNSAGLLYVKEPVLPPPMELNMMFRKERSKPKKKKTKKSVADACKGHTEKICKGNKGFHNSLDEELPEEAESEPIVDGDMANDSQRMANTAKGCLFLHCHRCPSMVRVKFASGAIPKMSVNLDAEYTNGVAITVCKSCDNVERDPPPFGNGWGGDRVTGCASKFRDLGLDPSLMERSNFMRAAELVANTYTPLMTAGGRLHFEERATILDYAKSEDEIASINADEVDSGNVNAILKPHLYGGFF